MKRFEHVTKGTKAIMSEPNVLIIDGTNERLEVSDITLRRWWKEVEEVATEEAAPAVEDKLSSEPMKMSETITALEVLFDKLNGIYFLPVKSWQRGQQQTKQRLALLLSAATAASSR